MKCCLKGSEIRHRALNNGTSELLSIRDDTTVEAFWCDFPIGNPAAMNDDHYGNCICVIGKQNIQFCPREGSQVYAVTLPFPISKVLPSPFGLILKKDCVVMKSSTDVTFPHLFSLSHPYNEILPIVCQNKDDKQSCHYALDPLELTAVCVLEGSSLLLCYNQRHHSHSLHLMRSVTKEEWKCAAAKVETIVSASFKGTPFELSSAGPSPACSSYIPTPRNRPRVGLITSALDAIIIFCSSLLNLVYDTSSRLASLYEDRGIASAIDMRGSELELIAPEVRVLLLIELINICIENIWTEPHRRQSEDMPCKEPATLSFLTTDLSGQKFACIYSSEHETLKCIRIILHDDGSLTTTRGFTAIKCLSATDIKDRNMMAVIEMDHSVVLYSGTFRLGSLYVQRERSQLLSTTRSPSNQSSYGITQCAPVCAVHSFCSGHFLVIWEHVLSRECSSGAGNEVLCKSDAAVEGSDLTKYTRKPCKYQLIISEDAELYEYIRFVLSALHNGYEQTKMDTRLAFLSPLLATSLQAIATLVSLDNYIDYYQRDFPDLANNIYCLENGGDLNKLDLSRMRRFSDRLISFHRTLLRIVEDNSKITSFSCPTKGSQVFLLIAIGFGKIENILDLQKAIGKNWEKKLGLSERETASVIEILDNDRLSAGDKCRNWACLFSIKERFLKNLPPSTALIICELLYNERVMALNFLPIPFLNSFRALPSEDEINRTIRLRWKYDMRFANASQMLDSSHPSFIPAVNGVSDIEQRELQEQMLAIVNVRTLTQCFGRAVLEFRYFVPPMNIPLNVPQLCLQGRFHPSNVPFEMQQNETTKMMTEWGAYYNGLATGLRIGNEQSCKLDGEWLALSISEQKDASSAGMMYAFGLNGHISKMNLFTIHELLSAGDRLMSVSVLLGCSANMLATGDQQIYKVLVTHLPFMMGPTLLELHIDPMVQTAALVGLGLLFAKTSHLGILNLLLNEVGKPAPIDQEPWTDRYAYRLAVGFAIGLISLGDGEQLSANVPFVERYPSLQSRLLQMMDGGPRSLCVFPTTNPTDVLLATPHVTATTNPSTTTNTHPDPINANTSQTSSHVLEFDNINPHLSSAAATIALGLMYLRTGNEKVAKRMRVPQTLSKLEKIRPDFLLLRTLCQSLIMWDEILPSKSYVDELIPAVIRSYVYRFFRSELVLGDGDAAYLSTIVDLETIAQSYLNIVAGACFAIGIRYASSFSSSAFQAIMCFIWMLLPEGNQKDADMRLCHAAGATVCASVLNQLIYSLGLIMAGSGNLEVLRLCRMLRRRVLANNAHKDITLYSTQVAVSTTVGLIMMGKGRYALSQSDLSIAAMIIAFFPVAPHNLGDNRLYLQPLRFLWSLAAEERLIDVVDAHSGDALSATTVDVYYKVCYLSSFISLHQVGDDFIEHVDHFQSPVILPELSTIEKIVLSCDGYESRTLNLKDPKHFELLKNVLGTGHGSLPLTRIGRYVFVVISVDVNMHIKMSCEEKNMDGSVDEECSDGSVIAENDLSDLRPSDDSILLTKIHESVEVNNDEDFMAGIEALPTRNANEDMTSENDYNDDSYAQLDEYEEQVNSEWTPSYADRLDKQIKRFSALFSTEDAHPFLRRYVQDLLENERTRFPLMQFSEVKAFLDRCERYECEPKVIPKHLISSVNDVFQSLK
ncbi:unnamed protein product [Anisakis simplex]|uniref:Anaphase-promoting complex subunit 1 (inferred by orthology to a human protein) n=1 Tax=Anisakis simplex TaxID=6269 RepID=A0A0M3JR14_ANISI|nr:unnamed protein product [Anisakis simplex]